MGRLRMRTGRVAMVLLVVTWIAAGIRAQEKREQPRLVGADVTAARAFPDLQAAAKAAVEALPAGEQRDRAAAAKQQLSELYAIWLNKKERVPPEYVRTLDLARQALDEAVAAQAKGDSKAAAEALDAAAKDINVKYRGGRGRGAGGPDRAAALKQFNEAVAAARAELREPDWEVREGKPSKSDPDGRSTHFHRADGSGRATIALSYSKYRKEFRLGATVYGQ